MQRLPRPTPAAVAESCGSYATTRIPSPRASRAVRRPMPPKPTMPSVLPAISRPVRKCRPRPAAAGDVRRASVGAAQQQHRRRDHVLGNGQRIGARGGDDFDIALARTRRRRCCRGRRRGAPRHGVSAPPQAARAFTCVRLRTISASASATAATRASAAIDELWVVERVVGKRERTHRGIVHELGDDDPSRTHGHVAVSRSSPPGR